MFFIASPLINPTVFIHIYHQIQSTIDFYFKLSKKLKSLFSNNSHNFIKKKRKTTFIKNFLSFLFHFLLFLKQFYHTKTTFFMDFPKALFPTLTKTKTEIKLTDIQQIWNPNGWTDERILNLKLVISEKLTQQNVI